jgi:spore germination cell wall hydrolase CwlJ-like protein
VPDAVTKGSPAGSIMLTTLLIEARLRPLLWRRRLAYWLAGAKEDLAFLAMLALLPLGAIGIVCFAYLDGTRMALAPIEPARIEAAQPEGNGVAQRADDVVCLAENIYFEARGEPLAGQYAVAEVTLNRTRARNFPHTICQVVHERRWDPNRRRYVADFSWVELGEQSPEDGRAWRQALVVASAAYDDVHAPIVPGALFYHATNVRPGWARGRTRVATIGNHIFYR